MKKTVKKPLKREADKWKTKPKGLAAHKGSGTSSSKTRYDETLLKGK